LLLRIMGGKGHQLNRTEKIFFGEIVFLLKTIFFVYIGMSMEFNDVKSLLAGLAITFMLFAGRIVLTRFVMPKSAPIFDKTITSIMIPKGLAAAVLAGIPLAAGVSGGEFIRNTTYAVILFSILWVSIMILLVDKWPAMRRFYFLLYGVRDGAEQGKSLFISTKDTDEEEEDGIGVLSRSASALLDYYKRKTGETPHKAADGTQPEAAEGTQPEAADETPHHTVSEELRKTESDECK
ncbi:MAG: cation:proton antiporter, partial [Bacteroidales bacterium]|nr:cation:proton antiporter [Bacteroidales bacterium]